ncbi:MAG TPA: polyprenyl synthetase family protein [Thermomicrobiales bacterium]|nr:polyprenyl synthetase family protein [Thermomicrobiales bacterium]
MGDQQGDATGTGLQDRAAEVIDQEIDTLLSEVDGEAPLLHRMVGYHLGLLASDGTPVHVDERRRLQGKRLRSSIALLVCTAAGGEIEDAGPLAAAIELLHNFTLVHDDIQDRSPARRHRPTVWRIWGDAQAINAGDALFAASQIGLLNTASPHVSPDHLLTISRAFNRMTIDIVRGQVLDLGFEGRSDVSVDAYLTMIEGKTAAIVQFAAWAGALLGGADIATARQYAAFGRALGLGFQIRDDALGVWGTVEATGKDPADDIRRRKQSFPVILLRAAASRADREALDGIFANDRIAEEEVASVLSMMETYDISRQVEERVRAWHDDAVATTDTLAATAEPRALDTLRHLIDRMADRSG